MIISKRGFIAGLGGAMLAGAGVSRAQADAFYKGRLVTVLVNYAAGGPTDVEGRLFAKYLARHLDGTPNVIVRNFDGAGGLIGTNYLGEIAPRDGTFVGYLTGAAWQSASDPTPRRVDFRTYEFVAYQPGTSIYFIRTDVAPGMKEPADVVKAKDVVCGGVGAGNAKDLLLRMTLDMLGIKFKLVSGYRGSQDARLALQRGEINFYSEGPAAYRATIEPNLVASGEVMPLFYDPGYNGAGFRVPKQMAGLAIPPFHEFYRTINGAEPSGKVWDAYRTIIALSGAMQRLIAMPPGTPPEAVAAIRKALASMSEDPEYREEGMKIGLLPDYVVDDGVNAQVRGALTVSPEMLAFIRAYGKGG